MGAKSADEQPAWGPYFRIWRYFPRERFNAEQIESWIGHIAQNPFRYLVGDAYIYLFSYRSIESDRDAATIEHGRALALGYIPVEFTFQRLVMWQGYLDKNFCEIVEGSVEMVPDNDGGV